MDASLEITGAFDIALSHTGQISPLSLALRWNKTSLEEAVAQQPCDPPTVRDVGLSARYVFHVPWVYQENREKMLQDVVNRRPVVACALHGDDGTLMFEQPVLEFNEVVSERLESCHLELLTALCVGPYQACGDRVLVNVQTTTNGMNNRDGTARIILTGHGGLLSDSIDVLWKGYYHVPIVSD